MRAPSPQSLSLSAGGGGPCTEAATPPLPCNCSPLSSSARCLLSGCHPPVYCVHLCRSLLVVRSLGRALACLYMALVRSCHAGRESNARAAKHCRADVCASLSPSSPGTPPGTLTLAHVCWECLLSHPFCIPQRRACSWSGADWRLPLVLISSGALLLWAYQPAVYPLFCRERAYCLPSQPV